MRKLTANLMIFLGTCCVMGGCYLVWMNYTVDTQGKAHCEEITTEFLTLVTVEQPILVPTEVETDIPEAPAPLPEIRNEGIYINGDLYMGLLEIPQVGLTLPIHMDLSYAKLNTAPCVYMGNLTENDLVIAGHNYRSHFWYLRSLGVGATMTITSPSGKVYHYVVDKREVLHETEVEVLQDRDEWALTLFTCEYPDSTYRVVLRCKRVM